MAVDERVLRRYEVTDEDARLWQPGIGDLVRLRTWDVLARFLPTDGRRDGEDNEGSEDSHDREHSGGGRLAGRRRVVDVGGGPGTHAAHLAERGYDVVLVDPVERHTKLAASRARLRSVAGPPAPRAFRVVRGEAGGIPLGDLRADAVLLMGPLYHLVEQPDRAAALREAVRVLRPGGSFVAEVITRHAWILDATARNGLGVDGVWDDFERNVRTGLSQDPAATPDGAFWAYFHTVDELRAELAEAGFTDVQLVAVEGFAWLLGDLVQRMADPAARADLLQAVRFTESEPSMLGVSAHVLGLARRPP